MLTSGIKIIDGLLNKNPKNFKIIADIDNKIMPYIGCTICYKTWHCYRRIDEQIRTNSRSNYVNHHCKTANPLTRIDNCVKEQLPKWIREEFDDFYTKTMPRYSMIKMNSGIQLTNNVANFEADLTMKTLKKLWLWCH